eukprot:13657394-Alexandrium_andersonii.AAC.1
MWPCVACIGEHRSRTGFPFWESFANGPHIDITSPGERQVERRLQHPRTLRRNGASPPWAKKP